MQNDPLWNLRHALAGVGVALLLSVLIAAMLGGALGDFLGGTYGWRAGTYGALLLYVVVGAFVLFAKVARFETRPLSAQRIGLWLASLWLWPGLLLVAQRAPGADAGATAAPSGEPPPRTMVPPTDPVMPPPRDEPPPRP